MTVSAGNKSRYDHVFWVWMLSVAVLLWLLTINLPYGWSLGLVLATVTAAWVLNVTNAEKEEASQQEASSEN